MDGVKAMSEPAMAIMAWSIVTNIALLGSGLQPLQTFGSISWYMPAPRSWL